ncbi:MAG: bifunctional demethylmenaquinone methyltransferase/2-methoxy-6-polyprenyl-1,4-benzoquinol methylase UbiE [Alistipes sp.]|nr:bifunctional demethylmenaquinone methyltransferase/2-methoxy-6-polyprenyl-1,4-benzoquinol methylase UbiE [Alistipes sp.]
MSEVKPQTEQVKQMFDDIAPTYDRLNHILSLSIDKLWRRRVVRSLRKLGAKQILDIATGTGDLAIAMARKIEGATICGADLSPQMLAVARQKVAKAGLEERITLMEGNAERLDLPSESVDAVTIAFGIRNFENKDRCLIELRRIIRQGGHLVILEFSNPKSRLIGWCYRLYSHKILPWVGGLISRNRSAYEYLPASVDSFPNPDKFSQIIEAAGFKMVKRRSQSFGIAQIYIAEKR